MKRKHDYKAEAAMYQRWVAALVHKIGGTVLLTPEDLKVGVEKGIEIAQKAGAVSLRVPLEFQSRIVTLNRP